jgi:hypothetical protein
MSKAEILSELPKLKPEERREVLESLWDLEERDLLNGIGPSTDEKALLNREHDEFEKHPEVGAVWSETKARLRSRPPG